MVTFLNIYKKKAPQSDSYVARSQVLYIWTLISTRNVAPCLNELYTFKVMDGFMNAFCKISHLERAHETALMNIMKMANNEILNIL
jgi:hypothetical protein